MTDVFRSAHSTADAPDRVASELIEALGRPPAAVALFFAPRHDGEAIAGHLRRAWPETRVVGCSTAGELSTGRLTRGGVSAAALDRALAPRSAVALARFDHGVARGVRDAVAELEAAWGRPLRALDPRTHVGLVLIDSTHAVEEAVHEELGNAAPLLSFVGGSAGDDLAFQHTRVLADAASTHWGCALMLLEVARPFEVVKLCHFEPTGAHFAVTRVDGRALLELDGRPAAQVYAEHVGVPTEKLTLELLGAHPAGLVIDGEPWVRQVVPPVHRAGAITLGCEIAAGSTLHFLRPKTDLVGHFRESVRALRERLGVLEGALLFDCALRRLELEATGAGEAYARALDFPAAGFHTHGESWLGHMHQTLTALAFGRG